MELTARHLRERFRALNEKYFDGELPEPQFVVSKARTQLGLFSCRKVRKGFFGATKTTDLKIRISEYFELTDEEIDDTLLHEMIHLKIAFFDLQDNSAHGHLFRKEMDRLNRMGRHLTISVQTKKFNSTTASLHKQHLVLALESVDGKFYLAVVNPDYKKYIEGLIMLTPNITTHHWLIRTDPYFNDFPQARSLRARKVSKEVYEEKVKG